MSITVVTTRDYEGAPTSRDVYADAVRYRIGDSNLEVYSERALLAFYGSGNWQTVLVDDPVQVHTGGPVDPSVYAGMPASPGAMTSDRVGPGGPSGRSAPAEVLPRVPSTVLQRPRPETPTQPPPTGIEPAAAEAPAPGAVNASEAMLARSPSMRRVRFAPKVYRAARPRPPAREPGTTWSRPASIRPVVFRPKKYKAAQDPVEDIRDNPPDDTPDDTPDGGA